MKRDGLRYLTRAQMQRADRRCIEILGIPGAVLMSHAGRAVFDEIGDGPVGIVCGKGNNGGDGFVVAGWCAAHGRDTQVVLLAEPDSIQGDAGLFLRAYQRMGGRVEAVLDARSAAEAVGSLARCAHVVDALLGTGSTGEVRGIYRAALEAWPAVRTVSVDLPSGMDPDSGKPCGACVKADATVTFQYPKIGFKASGAKTYLGRLVVADIGIPPVCADDEAWAQLGLGDV